MSIIHPLLHLVVESTDIFVLYVALNGILIIHVESYFLYLNSGEVFEKTNRGVGPHSYWMWERGAKSLTRL